MATSNPRDSAAADFVARVRHFNRFYTRQLGLLDRHLLGSPHTLAEARVLYELARTESTTATAIAADLGLDLGYLSRILKSFERRKYITRARGDADARQYDLRLTPYGRKQFAPLDRAARTQITGLIKHLTRERCGRLVDAMLAIERLLAAGPPEPSAIELRPLRPGDIGWVTHRQAVLYAQEYGWDVSYEALVAEILSGFVKSYDAATEHAWIAEREGQIVGSVFLVRASASVARLRLLYVEPDARGLGIGRRLVDECVDFARSKGYQTLTLWTNDVLVSARKIYLAAGFKLTGEEPHHSFGKDLIGQTWQLALLGDVAVNRG